MHDRVGSWLRLLKLALGLAMPGFAEAEETVADVELALVDAPGNRRFPATQ